MTTILDTQQLKLIHDVFETGTALNYSVQCLEADQDALERALIALENAGFSETGFKWGDQTNNTHPDPQRLLAAAHALIEKLDTEGSPAAAREQEELIDALEQYETSQQRGGN